MKQDNVDYCFTDCILVQCWPLFHWLYFCSMLTCFIVCILVQCCLLFRWLYFGLMLTIVSLTVFWFNVDYCFIDCILVQCWLLFRWLYFGSMLTKTIVKSEPKYSQWNKSTLNKNTVSETMVNIEPKYSQWNNSQHRTKIQSVKQ
jgi:hypothetical protein